jgi:hypothetical protein
MAVRKDPRVAQRRGTKLKPSTVQVQWWPCASTCRADQFQWSAGVEEDWSAAILVHHSIFSRNVNRTSEDLAVRKDPRC